MPSFRRVPGFRSGGKIGDDLLGEQGGCSGFVHLELQQAFIKIAQTRGKTLIGPHGRPHALLNAVDKAQEHPEPEGQKDKNPDGSGNGWAAPRRSIGNAREIMRNTIS